MIFCKKRKSPNNLLDETLLKESIRTTQIASERLVMWMKRKVLGTKSEDVGLIGKVRFGGKIFRKEQ